MSDLQEAIKLIDDFLQREYADTWEEDFSDLSRIDLAYEVSEDEMTETVARANLIDFRVDILLGDDEVLVRREQFGSLREMIDKVLRNLDPQELVKVSDDEIKDLDHKMMEAFKKKIDTGDSRYWDAFNQGLDR